MEMLKQTEIAAISLLLPVRFCVWWQTNSIVKERKYNKDPLKQK